MTGIRSRICAGECGGLCREQGDKIGRSSGLVPLAAWASPGGRDDAALKGKHKPHLVSFPVIVTELSRRSLNIFGCCFTLGLSLAMLACLFFSVFARCEQIFREDGGQDDCGVGIGWVLVGVAFVVIAVYSLYRFYGMWREGEDVVGK